MWTIPYIDGYVGGNSCRVPMNSYIVVCYFEVVRCL